MAGVSLDVSGIKVVRSSRTILDIQRLQIPAGQFVHIIGTNGAGKTTLMKILCGLLAPDAGQVHFGPTCLTALNPWSKSNLRRHIGYIPQSAEYNSHLPFTVREVAAMGRSSVKPLLTRLNRSDYAIVDQWLQAVGLADQSRQTFNSLSGGEQQKVLIARAMAQQPSVLMLDEPTSNLDINWKLQIIALIRRLTAELNLTTVMISHDIQSLLRKEDRTVLLHAGRVAIDGLAQMVFESSLVRDIYPGLTPQWNKGSDSSSGGD